MGVMKKTLPLALIGAAASGPAFANGFALEAQSPRALGAAFAGAQASRADATYAFYNPAAIVGVDGVALSANAVGLISDSGFDNASGVLFGVAPVAGDASGQTVIGDVAFPTFAVAAPLGGRWFAGVTLSAPFGLDSTYPTSSVLRYHALESELRVIAATPVIGVEIGGVAIAAGPRLQYSELTVTGAIDAAGAASALSIPGFTPGTSDALFALEGDAFDIGFVVGAQASPAPDLHVGFSFSSKVVHDIEGDAAFDISTSLAGQTLSTVGGLFQDGGFSSTFATPATLQLGVDYEATPSLTLSASGTVTRWSSFEGLAVIFDNPSQPPEVLTQDWRDGWAASVGAEWRPTTRDALRAGVMYDESPVNDRFASPRIPDGDRVWLTAGYGRNLSERVAFDVAFAYLRIEDRPIALPGLLPENQLRGALTADLQADAVILSAGFDFRF